MKRMFLGASVLLAGLAGSTWALPTRNEVYRNDDSGIVVYKDSEDPEVFWFLPSVQLLRDSTGQVKYRKRVNSAGNTDYTFYIVPSLSAESAEYLANEIPGLHNRSQLKPVYARKFGLQVKHFNVVSTSDDVTDYHYLNQPQMVRLSLNPDQAADFEDLFQEAPGVPANVVIYYQSERVQKFLKIELSYKEVYDAMRIQASGRYTFTRGEIEANMSKYLSNKYLSIRRKGDINIPEIVEKVIAECFTPLLKNGRTNPGGVSPTLTPGNDRAKRAEIERNRKIETLLLQRGLRVDPASGLVLDDETTPDPSTTGPGTPGTSETPETPGTPGTPGAVNNKDLQFTFKKELAKREEKFLFVQEDLVDADEIAMIPTYIARTPDPSGTRVVVPLGTRDVTVTRAGVSKAPKRSGIVTRPGDQWTINASFSFFAVSPYRGTRAAYRWDASWPTVEGDLYFRIGDGPWQKVNGRATVGGDALRSGEIQFYVDRPSIWAKIPDEYKSSSMLGLVPAIFSYKDFYPEFNVTLTGRRVEVRR